MQLRTEIFVSALVRRAEVAGAFAAVVARGDGDAGDVVVKINALNGAARVFVPSFDLEGERAWIEPIGDGGFVAEADADAYVRRRLERDPDTWVVEIEDKAGRSFLD